MILIDSLSRPKENQKFSTNPQLDVS